MQTILQVEALTKQFWLHVPKKDDDKLAEPAPPDANPPVVLTVTADGKAFVHKDEVADAELSRKLLRVFAARSDTVLFFDAHDDAPYGRAMEVMDLARGGGALTIAVLTEKVAR